MGGGAVSVKPITGVKVQALDKLSDKAAPKTARNFIRTAIATLFNSPKSAHIMMPTVDMRKTAPSFPSSDFALALRV